MQCIVSNITFQSPALAVRKQRAVCERRWLHEPQFMSILRPHASTSQSSVAVTHYILGAAHSFTPGGMVYWVEIGCSGNWTRTSCTHEWTCFKAANDLTTELARQTDTPYFFLNLSVHQLLLWSSIVAKLVIDLRFVNSRLLRRRMAFPMWLALFIFELEVDC